MTDDLDSTARAFVEMAHRIVWCTVATVGPDERPRTRVLHPIWDFDGSVLSGRIATAPTALKRSHLDHSPFVSLTYWNPQHDTCTADCRVTWAFDDETRQDTWERFRTAPAPVGYDPSIIPEWSEGALSPRFAVLLLEPIRLRVFPGTALTGGGGRKLVWEA